MVCSAFLIKKPEILRKICSHGNFAHYLFLGDAEDVDLGRISLQCGRRNDALKLFLAWREKGDAGWARLVENYVELADYFQSKIENHSSLEMMSSRVWSNVCIRYTANGIKHNVLNKELRDRLVKSGKFMISQSKIRENIILRPVIANSSVGKKTIDELIDEITRIGDDMKNIQTKRDVLRVWLKNAKESKKLRDDYAKATQFHQLSLKLNALHAWNLKTRHSKQCERESFREWQINEQIADTFRRVSLKQKALRAWRVRVFNSWRERLATEMGYRNVARRVLRGWHRRVVY